MLEVTALRTGSRVQRMSGIARVEDRIAAEAELMCIITDRSDVAR